MGEAECLGPARLEEEVSELRGSMNTLTVRKAYSNLLDLPAELRNHIYRHVFEDLAMVTASTFPEPALLLACKQLRREAGHILYSESTFCIRVTLNTEAALAFFQKRSSVLNEFGIFVKQERVQHSTPNWHDLMLSLRRHHGGHVAWVDDQETTATSLSPSDIQEHTVKTMLALVNELSDLPWSRVASVLGRHRTILIAADPRWA